MDRVRGACPPRIQGTTAAACCSILTAIACQVHQFGKPKHRIGVYNAVPEALELKLSPLLSAGYTTYT